MGYDHTDEAMLELGWEKFYLNGTTWKRKRKINDIVQDKSLSEIYGDTFNMLVDFLEPGDLLCCTGHVEFYIGYNYNVIYNNANIGKASGIKSITIGNKAQQGHSTFGWGGLHNTFPIEDNYFTYIASGFKRHCAV